jgi:DNA helicase-2/ATP-dependent DNA helicase PcrA
LTVQMGRYILITSAMETNLASLPATLTLPQREAILHLGSPLLIIAGPGSGKTEVIAWRVAYMVQAELAKPENILATTFTNKAALELKDRIQSKLREINVELMQVSTIHSFCADLLRRYPRQANLLSGFSILDETGQFLFVYSRRKELGLDERIKGLEDVFYSSVIDTFNRATEEQVAPEDLAAWYKENLSCCKNDEAGLWQEREAIAEAYQHYCQLLEEENLLDFASLQTFALRLLENNPQVLEELRRKYLEILVDEYQDTNITQEKLLKLLAGDGTHLTVVGDDDQSIYRFRGATVRNILEFSERYPNAKVVQLVHNFRSRDQIVDHSLQVIAHNPARYGKDLLPVRGPGSEVLLVYEHTAGEEAASVVDLILRLHQAGRISRFGDIAVLLRSVKSYAEPYVNALLSAGIPYQVIGDASFFDRPEITQLYNLLNFLGASKPWADVHVRLPLVGLSLAACEGLRAYKGSLMEMATPEGLASIGIPPGEDQKRLLDLLKLKKYVQDQKQETLLEVFYKLLATTGCAARFERQGNLEALSNLGIFSQLVAAWDEGGTSRNFYPFMEYLKLVRKRGLDPFLPLVEDSVRIMTIHQAKGLEFPVVVLGAAMDGRLPAMRRKDPYEIPAHLRASGEPEVSDPHLVDERKLFYVAATRARDLLVVGTADLVNKRGGGPSPFLTEMFGPDLHAAAAWSLGKVKDIESRAGKTQEPRPRHSFSELSFFLQCPMR